MALREDNLTELLQQFMSSPTTSTDTAAWYWATALRDYFLSMRIVTLNARPIIVAGAAVLATALMETFGPASLLVAEEDRMRFAYAPVDIFKLAVNNAIMGSTLGTTASIPPPKPFWRNMPSSFKSFKTADEAIEDIASSIYIWSKTGTYTKANGVTLKWG